MKKDTCRIKQAIVHILDNTAGMPVLSQECMELSSGLHEFLETHIEKVTEGDDCKHCRFMEESEFLQALHAYHGDNFIEFSQALANGLYQIMYSNPTIPSADLVILLLESEAEEYIGILKMNYKESYTHQTQSAEAGNRNSIVLQQAILPGSGQRLSEACLIRLSDESIQLLEKKYEINGAKINYFSELYLQCHAPLSQKTKLELVTKAVEQVNKKYYPPENVQRQMEVKHAIYQELEETGELSVESVGEKVFHDNPQMKEDFEERVEKYHLKDAEVRPTSPKTVKKFEKQHLTTDNGIEITIPMEEYQNKDRIQFITNVDGTVSILIQNVSGLTSK